MASMQSACMRLGSGRLLLALHTGDEPSTGEWGTYLALAQTAESAEQGNVGKILGLVVTDGGSPDAVQRAQLTHVLGGRRVLSAIITEHVMIRLVVGALRWLNKNAEVRVFAPNESEEALRFLGLSAPERREALTVLRLLQRRMDPVTTLGAMLASMRAM